MADTILLYIISIVLLLHVISLVVSDVVGVQLHCVGCTEGMTNHVIIDSGNSREGCLKIRIATIKYYLG